MYILGGVALVGVAYYLYTKNKPSATPSTSSFSNLEGGGGCLPNPCPAGFECRDFQPRGGHMRKRCIQVISGEK